MAILSLEIIPSRRRALPRRIPKMYAPLVRKYAKQTGTILWAYNRTHGSLGDSFAALINRNDLYLGRAAWHALKADTAQRDMLRAVLATKKKVAQESAEALEWIIDVLGKISQHRNDAAHTPMAQTISATSSWLVIPDPVSGDPARVGRLKRDDLARFHKLLEGDLVSLMFYAFAVKQKVAFPTVGDPLPKMPLLRSLPRSEVPPTRSQKDRQKAQQQQKRQQRASRRK